MMEKQQQETTTTLELKREQRAGTRSPTHVRTLVGHIPQELELG